MSQKSYEAENTRTDLIDGITDAQKKLSGVMGEVQAACIKCQNIHELKLAVREQQIEKLNGDYMALLDQADGLREENEKLTKELSLRKEYK